jgi:hypothetical protein
MVEAYDNASGCYKQLLLITYVFKGFTASLMLV